MMLVWPQFPRQGLTGSPQPGNGRPWVVREIKCQQGWMCERVKKFKKLKPVLSAAAASGGIQTSVGLRAIVGAKMSVEGMRSILTRIASRRPAPLAGFGGISHRTTGPGLNSNRACKSVLKAVGPVLTGLDRRNPFSQAISAISQAGSNPAAFELGRIVYGAQDEEAISPHMPQGRGCLRRVTRRGVILARSDPRRARSRDFHEPAEKKL